MVRFILPSPYEPVDSAKGQIRLLVLYPCDPSSRHARTIRCDLEYAYLSSKPQYEALSYTWGTEGEIPSEIRLGSQQFEVRENVAAALRRLRHAKKARVLWIDAICINQEDLAERAAQVLLMKQIYSLASQVCVWLGEPGDAGIVGMQMLQNQKKVLGAHWTKWKIDRDWGRQMLWNRKTIKQSAAFVEKGNLEEEFTLGEARELLTRPWWRRMWAIQEAVVASRIVLMCGEETAPWESVEKFHQYLTKSRSTKQPQVFGHSIHEKDFSTDAGYQIISDYRERWQSSPSNVNILDLLYRFRNFDCEDPRDRIFAFLGIAPSMADMGIVPDYERSLTEVYTQFARKVITATGFLDILNCKREWRGVEATPSPERCYSLLDQSRYYDVDAEVTYGPDKKTKRGWARLPDGWERITQGKGYAFFDHNTGMIHDKSPLEGQPPTPAESFTKHRELPPGWTRTWNNLGLSQIHYGTPEKKTTTDEEETLRVEKKESQQAELSELPSWVPNWANPTPWDPVPLIDFSRPAKQRFSASGDTRCTNLPQQTPGNSNTSTLSLHGYILDTISQTSDPWHPPSDSTIPPISAKGVDPFQAWETLATAPVLPLLNTTTCNTIPCSSSLDGPYTRISHPELTTSPRYEAFLHTLIAANSPPSTNTNTTNGNISNNNSNNDINTTTPPTSNNNNDDPNRPSIDTRTTTNASSNTTGTPTSTGTTKKDIKSLESLLHTKAFLTWSPPQTQTNTNINTSYETEFQTHFNTISIPVVASVIENSEELNKFLDSGKVTRTYGEILTRVMRTCANRALFVTRGGYIGLGGWNSAVGDLVCLFEGGGTPFLLRRRTRRRRKQKQKGKGKGEEEEEEEGGEENIGEEKQDEEGKKGQGGEGKLEGEGEGVEEGEKEEREEELWELVGETYVYGLMNGEALKMGLDRREFKIV